MVKPSSATVGFLGAAGLGTAIIAALFISDYYQLGPSFPYQQVKDISVGSFITLTGGIATLASAILYSLHFRTPISENKTQTGTPVL